MSLYITLLHFDYCVNEYDVNVYSFYYLFRDKTKCTPGLRKCIIDVKFSFDVKSKIFFAIFKKLFRIFFSSRGNVVELKSVTGNRVEDIIIFGTGIFEGVQY